MKTAFEIGAFLKEGDEFLQRLLSELRDLGLKVDRREIDHLCYRVASEAEYLQLRSQLARSARLLTETMVNGRLIATFQLSSPFAGGIDLVELPAPKSGTIYKSGFEHAEFVLKESFGSFAARHPHLSFATSGDFAINPELSLRTKVGTAKFHPTPLDRVIEIEEAEITDVVLDLDGTLVCSREKIYEINRVVFSELCAREVSIEESKEKFSPEFKRLFEAFGIQAGPRQVQAVRHWSQVSRSFTYELFDEIPLMLRSLKARGLRLHLWTARDEDSAIEILRRHEISELFTSLSFGSAESSKPEPDSLRFPWRSLSSGSLLLLGDSATDMRGAHKIGAVAAAALWDPFARLDDLLEAGAELFLRKPGELAQWCRPPPLEAKALP